MLLTQSDRFFNRFTKEDNIRSRELVQKAVELDPKYAGAYTALGFTHLLDAQAGWGKSRADSLKRAVELAQVAVNLDDTFSGTSTLPPTGHIRWPMSDIVLISSDSPPAPDILNKAGNVSS